MAKEVQGEYGVSWEQNSQKHILRVRLCTTVFKLGMHNVYSYFHDIKNYISLLLIDMF